MNILWMGSEDADLAQATNQTAVITTNGNFRSGVAREAFSNHSTTAFANSVAFQGGGVTSCWFHFRWNWNGGGTGAAWGLTSSSSANGAGIWVGSATAFQCALYKYDGTTLTQLAAEAGTSLEGNQINSGDCPTPVDMHLQSFGATATVDVYVRGVQVIHWTGSLSGLSGITSVDTVSAAKSITNANVTELVVADSDTRLLNVFTLNPSTAGDTNTWASGTNATINPTTLNDATFASVNTTGNDLQWKGPAMPSTGAWQIHSVKIMARANLNASSVPTGLKLGVKTGGSVFVGAAHTLTTSMQCIEDYRTTNPNTAVAWTTADINALQGDLQSA
jgi:hypothetical protein